jgi:amino acid adenylation domain-containing protein
MQDASVGPKFAADKLELLAQLLAAEDIEIIQTQTIAPRANPDDLPLSFAQQRLWFLDQWLSNTPLYIIPATRRYSGPLDIAALHWSLNEIVRRHATLRTTFATVDGEPVQQIAPTLTLPLPLIDLQALPPDEREAEVRRLVAQEAQQPFDLERGPLIRSHVLRLAPDEHVLLLTMHHIISDGWSIGVFERELATLYNSYVAGQPDAAALDELPIQYVDFAHWQRQWLQGSVLDEQISYWQEQLRGAPPLLQLPTDRPRPAMQTFRGSRRFVELPPALSAGLKALSQQEDATLFMTLLAAFQTLLHRYSGQDDILVGTPIAGRTQVETEGVIGFFVNTLVLRTQLEGNPTFRELLGRVRETCLQGYAHQDLPFEHLMEVVQPSRTLSYTPLFQVMFALQAASSAPPQLRGLTQHSLWGESETAKFDLTLDLLDTDQGLRGSLEYNTDLFDVTTIDRMLGHFATLLSAIVADPSQHLADLPLLTAAERAQLLGDTLDRPTTPPSADSLVTLFETQAARTPDAVAVVWNDQRLSYAELNRRANQLAHHLQAQGVGPDTLVGMCMERSLELVVSILAIVKAGGAYVPLDPAAPKDRLQFIVEDARLPLLLSQQHLLERLPESAAALICVDRDWTTIGAAPTDNPAAPTDPDQLAYIIYTSGSTGKPKGVQVTHRNVVRLFSATQAWFAFGAQDVWTLFHSYAFDFSVWELWGALLYGGRLVIVPYLTSRSPEAFYDLLCAEHVTVLNQTPSAFTQLIRVDGERAAALDLRLVIFGGEALDFASLRPWIARRGDQQPQLINMYGITETTVHVTYHPLTAGEIAAAQGSRIGRAIPDLQLYVLDRYQQLAPIGVAGELYVGGAGLARGYLNRPALTAERFGVNPWSAHGERLYKTGDVVRYLADGALEYLGRSDQQVKIRGFRIELGEIEATLLSHPALRDVVVRARQTGEGGALGEKQLVAYVVAQPGETVTIGELRSFLKTHLPEYMTPASFVMLPALPLTINGKVDDRALPAPGAERPDLAEAYVAPQTRAEEQLATVWQTVLGLSRVGVHDNFFALGGDSIRSVRVLALAKQAGLQFSLQQLFQYQTIHELAQVLEISETTPTPAPRTAPFSLISSADRERLPANVEDAYPLTMLQAGMLYHMQLLADSSVYHNVDSFHLRARFDLEAFRTAVQQVVARHPVLRTSFDLTSYEEPLQLVHTSATLPIGAEDLRDRTPDEQAAIIAEYRERERWRRFDLSQPPLLRFYLHRRTDETFQFTLTECHAILDGWSLTSTIAEIFNHYQALLDQASAPAEPPLTLTFRDFVQLERETLASAECQQYWDEQLRDHTPIKLPRWPTPPPSPGSERIRHFHPHISPELSAGLQRLALSAGVPIKTVLLAAHLKVMSMIGGRPDVISGLVCNGRPEEVDGERVRGLFLNTVPLCHTVESGSWRDLIRAAFNAEHTLLPFRRYPLAALQKRWGGQQFFEIIFNYVHFHTLSELVGAGNFAILSLEGSEETSFTLMVAFSQDVTTGQVRLLLDWDASQLHEEQIATLGGYYLRILEAMASTPLERHDQRSWLAPIEQQALLHDWNATAAAYPRTARIHELFEAQAARTPEASALVTERGTLSYHELNARANQLAHYLRRQGVGAETLVGICLERSADLIVGLLAILKAGGAYVPLDPAYPADRLRYIVQDAQAPLLITRSALAPLLAESVVRQVRLDADQAQIDQAPTTNPDAAGEADQLAYVLYTSGSTGRPKGVAIAHRSAVNFIHWARQVFTPADLQGVLAATSVCFDLSIFELFVPLSMGGAALLAENALHIPTLPYAEQITLINTVPSAMAELVRVGGIPSSVRVINLAGEPLAQELVEQIYQRSPVRQVFNLYGPTEATTYATFTAVERGAPTPPTIGRPVANTQIYLLDAQMEPVPVGVPGELYIGGDSVARGYLNRPALTAEKFTPDPFNDQPGRAPAGRLYRTGDLARYLPDGQLEYLGRIDQQVKIRGFRIELGEIEVVLRQHPNVRETVVLARAEDGEQRLTAYLVVEQAQQPTISELRGFVRERLPEYMTPAVFMFLPALPLTPSGKIDRRALPAPERLRPSLDEAFVAPRTAIERTIAGLWQDMLRVEQVGLYDNFFDLGGDSLALIRLHSKLSEAFPNNILMTDLFKHATISALAAYLSQDQSASPSFQQLQDRAKRQKQALNRRPLPVNRSKKSHE